MAWSHTLDVVYRWSDHTAESWANALKFAKQAIDRDDEEAWGHWALAGYYRFRGETDRAMAEYRRAAELNPNDADVLADFSYCMSFGGSADEGVENALRAMRLNPHYPDWYVEGLALAHHSGRRYEEAIGAMAKIRGAATVLGYLVLAASHVALDHAADAQEAIGKALEIDPEATIARWTSVETTPYKRPEDLEHLRDGLRKAGLTE
jgi:adenylate cyclase